MNTESLTKAEKNRYSRQIKLPEIGEAGQETLKNSKIIIFGLGGLGSPVSIYLTAAGIGNITLVDFDVVDDSNLQRQIVHREININEPKVESAQQNLQQINQYVQIDTINQKLSQNEALDLIQTTDLVLDCTDNFDTRFLLNKLCFKAKKPLVSGAAIRWEGQISSYDFRKKDQACYQCLYPDTHGHELNCARNGVASPIVGIVGSMQAIEAVKLLLNLDSLAGKLLILDAMTMKFQTLNLTKVVDCPTCSII